MGDLTVTALITNYDYAGYLGQAIDSVLDQEYPGPIELLVVDDGSTDHSDEVLARYGDRVRVIRQENRGQLLAMREGLAAGTGGIVCFLDADDAWTPDKVARVVAAMEREGAAWLAHGLRLCDADLRPLGVDVAPAGRPGVVPPEPVLFLERRVGTATSALALRADAARLLVEEIDRLTTEHAKELRYDADRALIALLGRARLPGYQLPDALALYRRHDRQQFAGGDGRTDARIALLERQIAVDRLVGRILGDAPGGVRVPTPVYKHALIVATLRGGGGRWRLLLLGLEAAARLVPEAPRVALRQAAALVFAWAAPRRWLRRAARRAGGE